MRVPKGQFAGWDRGFQELCHKTGILPAFCWPQRQRYQALLPRQIVNIAPSSITVAIIDPAFTNPICSDQTKK